MAVQLGDKIAAVDPQHTHIAADIRDAIADLIDNDTIRMNSEGKIYVYTPPSGS
jgi:hypothetical protein